MSGLILPKVLNRKRDRIPSDAVTIGRPSIWGNPFGIGRDGDRAGVIAKHRRWLAGQAQLLRRLPSLRGCSLVCFCAPLGCHGDALLWLANPDLRTALAAADEDGRYAGLSDLERMMADALNG
jgi:hypothetical protein